MDQGRKLKYKRPSKKEIQLVLKLLQGKDIRDFNQTNQLKLKFNES